jgi:hypothetical protein
MRARTGSSSYAAPEASHWAAAFCQCWLAAGLGVGEAWRAPSRREGREEVGRVARQGVAAGAGPASESVGIGTEDGGRARGCRCRRGIGGWERRQAMRRPAGSPRSAISCLLHRVGELWYNRYEAAAEGLQRSRSGQRVTAPGACSRIDFLLGHGGSPKALSGTPTGCDAGWRNSQRSSTHRCIVSMNWERIASQVSV